jgi:acyl carrier protein
LDEQIKIRGFRVEPGEIEASLLDVPGISAAQVVALEDPSGSRRLIAYCVKRPTEFISAKDVKSKLAKTLPDYMVPSIIVFIGSMPLTPNGKVDRRALPKPEQEIAPDGEAYVPVHNALESRIAAVWSDVLQVQRISSTDNFFELGGDSLSAVRVVLRLSQEFGLEIFIRTLFDHPSVEALTKTIAESMHENLPRQQL